MHFATIVVESQGFFLLFQSYPTYQQKSHRLSHSCNGPSNLSIWSAKGRCPRKCFVCKGLCNGRWGIRTRNCATSADGKHKNSLAMRHLLLLPTCMPTSALRICRTALPAVSMRIGPGLNCLGLFFSRQSRFRPSRPPQPVYLNQNTVMGVISSTWIPDSACHKAQAICCSTNLLFLSPHLVLLHGASAELHQRLEQAFGRISRCSWTILLQWVILLVRMGQNTEKI